MQFSAVLNIFIVKTWLNSTFTNDIKRKYFFSKNVHSYRVCSFKLQQIDFTNVSICWQINGKQNTTFQFSVELISDKRHKETFKLVLIKKNNKLIAHTELLLQIIYG